MPDSNPLRGWIYRSILLVTIIWVALGGIVPDSAVAQTSFRSFIVRVRPGVDGKEARERIGELGRRMGVSATTRAFRPTGSIGARTLSVGPLDRYIVADIAEDAGGEFLAGLQADPTVEVAFPNRSYHIDASPNDSLYGDQWALKKIEIEAAWGITTGDSSVLVAIIDTGIDFFHPDLLASLSINPAEDINHNGRFDPWFFSDTVDGVSGDIDLLDQDGNGFADDVIGYDFVDQVVRNVGDWSERDPVPFDPLPGEANAHGTNVAGIIGAARDNRIGIAGIAPGARILVVRAFDAGGDGEDDDIASAIVYAADRGAKVINMSFGDSYYSPLMHDAIRYAYSKGAVLVGSSGNDGGIYQHYPSDYPEVIAVAAVDPKDLRTSFSTSGSQLSISAPGAGIETTSPGEAYTAGFSGTSASAPHVSGVAALLVSLHPDWTPDEVRTVMELSANDLNTRGWDVDYGAGRLNARRALESPGPASVAVLSPEGDRGFWVDTTITIVGSAMAPFLESWQLFYGFGDTPRSWTKLGEPQSEGRVDDSLGTFSTVSMPDTTITIRLLLRLTDGVQTERRVRIFIDRTAATITGGGPVIHNVWRFSERAVAVSLRTDDLTRSTVWLRRSNQPGLSYHAVDLEPLHDGLTHTHYHILTDREMERGVPYDMYIELRNATGLVTLVGSPRLPMQIVRQPDAFPVNTFSDALTPYTLPFGYPLNRSFVYRGDGRRSIVMNRFRGEAFDKLMLYTFDGTRFTPDDSSGNWVPRGIGDSDGDGLTEVLGQDVDRGIVFEQPAGGRPPLEGKLFVDTTSGAFYASGMYDFDGDGRDELIVRGNEDTSAAHYSIRKWNGSGYDEVARLENPTAPPPGFPFNRYGNAETVVGDFDGDGLPEVLSADDDNDFMIHERQPDGTFTAVWKQENSGENGSPLIAGGDLDGDGADEIIVAFRSNLNMNDDREYDPPFWTVRVYHRFDDGHDTLLWEQEFAYVRSPRSFRSTIAAVDLDGRPGRELVISLFPNLYVLRWDNRDATLRPLWWNGQAENYRILAQDFNGDGIPELGIGVEDSIRFVQIDPGFRGPDEPTALRGWGLSDSTVHLEWNPVPGADYYTIYRARSTGSRVVRFDSVAVTTASSVLDTGFRKNDVVTTSGSSGTVLDTLFWLPDNFYLYIVTARDLSLAETESRLSNSARVLTHRPARVVGASPVDARTFTLRLDFFVRQDLYRSGAIEVRNALTGADVPISTISMSNDFDLVVALLEDHAGDSLLVRPTWLFRDRFDSPADTTTSIGLRMSPGTVPGERFIATRAYRSEGKIIAIDFNAPVDPAEASDISGYEIDPPGTILAAGVDPDDPSRVLLTLPADYPLGPFGLKYTVAISDLHALDRRLINDGAGSVVGFTLEANDLSSVFVYPHPFSPTRDLIATFAGVTRNATVEIFTQSGQIVRELTATNTAGGVEWDGEDQRGRTVPTGVYLYRIVGTAPDGSSYESDVRKIAVVP